jgi:hypothetical protein
MNTDANATAGSKNSQIRATDEYYVRGRRLLVERTWLTETGFTWAPD